MKAKNIRGIEVILHWPNIEATNKTILKRYFYKNFNIIDKENKYTLEEMITILKVKNLNKIEI